MKTLHLVALALAAMLASFTPHVFSQNSTDYTFITLAGGAGIHGTNDGAGSAARFYNPLGVAVDGEGNVYVGDTDNHIIRKVTALGVVTTLAGRAGIAGTEDGTGDAARFYGPTGLAADSLGNVYVADRGNQKIRKITPFGVVTTLAGTPYAFGTNDGTGSAALFHYPNGVAVDTNGNVYVADTYNHTIRKITAAGEVTTLAGLGSWSGTNDGAGSAARFNSPSSVAVDTNGNVYVADNNNHTIRKITSAGIVTTLAGRPGNPGPSDGSGSAAQFNNPSGVAVDSAGNVFVADRSNHEIRKVTAAGAVTTLAGRVYDSGTNDGTGDAVRFYWPNAVAVDSAGNLYVSDDGNQTIRKGWPASSTRLISLTASLNFGNVVTGATAMTWMTISNLGNETLRVVGIEYPDRFGGDWSGAIAAGGSQIVTVTFTPTAGISYGGLMTLYSDATDGSNTMAISGAGIAARATPPADLVGWWPGDSNTLDVISGNNGLLTNGATYVTGEVGPGFLFTNMYAGVVIANSPVLQLQDFTISAWIRRQSASVVTRDTNSWQGCGNLFSFGANGYGLGIHSNGGFYLAKVSVDNSLPARGSVTDTNFHYVAVTKSGTNLIFYVDGVAFPEPVPYVSTFQFTTPACIGAAGDTLAGSFFGTIDELTIFSRPLTSNEITAIYVTGSVGMLKPKALVAAADTYLTPRTHFSSSTAVHGTETSLSSIGAFACNYPLIRFDVSSLAGRIVINTPRMEVFLMGGYNPSYLTWDVWGSVSLREVLIPWDEATTSWDSFGATGATNFFWVCTNSSSCPNCTNVGAIFQSRWLGWPESGPRYVSWYLPDSLVQRWIDQPSANNGLLLDNLRTDGSAYLYFSSRENTNGCPPRLFVDTIEPFTPRVILLSDKLEFGNVLTGAIATATLTISNAGNSSLTVSNIAYPRGFSGAWSGTIAARGSQNVTVAFAPSIEDSYGHDIYSYGGPIWVNSDATGGISETAAFGNGVASFTRVIVLSGNLAFGNVVTGATATAPMTISNAGNSTLTVSSITNPLGFSSTWSGTIAAGASRIVPVTFAPTALGSYGGDVVVNCDATSGANTIAASGTGAVRILVLSGNLAFGNVEVGTNATATLTISNAGNATLSVYYIAYPSGFSGPSSAMIAAGSSTNLTVTFAPTAAGNYSSNIVMSSDATAGTNSIAVSGTGVVTPTRILVLSGNLAFGNVVTGATATATLTISNAGNNFLYVSSITYPFGFSGPCNSVLLVGGWVKVTVTFAPTTNGSYGGLVTVNSDATSGTNGIPISGTSTFVPTRIIALGGNLAFGSVVTGATATATLTISNAGNSTLTVSNISYPNGFSVAWSNATVSAGGATNVTVTFAPTAVDSYNGNIVVSSDATGGTNSIAASGAGVFVPTRIIALGGNLAFANVVTGATAAATLTISNLGNVPLTVTNLACPSGFNAAWSGAIAAGGIQNVAVTFAPTQVVMYSANLNIISDATSGGSAIALFGAGANAGGCVGPPAGLVAWWPADGNPLDLAGTNHAMLSNGMVYAAGKVGQAFGFNGTSACVASTTPDLKWISNNFTMMFWAWPAASRSATVEANGGATGTSGQCYAIYPTWGGLRGTGLAGSGVSVGTNGISIFEHAESYIPSLLVTNLAVTNWTHIAVAYSNRSPSLFVNGLWVRTGFSSTQSCVFPSKTFGDSGSYGRYNGLLDEVSIYNRPLTGNEIAAVYAAGSAGMLKSIGGAISVSGNLAFGNVVTGATATATLMISSAGNTALTVSSIAYPSGFSGTWSNGTIAAGAVTNVTVTFAPTTVGSYGGNIIVTNDATSGTNTIAASGNGVVAPTRIIALSGNLAFGNVVTGATATATLMISNAGNSTLTVSNIGYPSGFSGTWSNGTITAGAATNVMVTFAPTTLGSYGGNVIVTNDATGGTNTIVASGTGVVAPTRIIALSGNLAFGIVVTGATATATLLISNAGNSTLTVSNIGYPSGFSGTWSNGTITAGAATNVMVTFAPTSTGNYSNNIVVYSDATAGTNSIAVSGIGVVTPTRIIALSGNLAFGNVVTGATATATLVISNAGNSTLTVSNIGYPSGFSGTWSNGTITAGAATNVMVTFAPPTLGSYGGNVIVTNDATGGTNSIAASGMGVAAVGATSDFDAGNDGWMGIDVQGPPYNSVARGPYALVWQAGGGHPGGRVGTTDTAGTLYCFSAPAKYLGNRSDWLNKTLSYELQFQNDGLSPGAMHPDVILIGGGLTLVAKAGVDPATQTGTWVPFAVAFREDQWQFDTLDGPHPTASQFQTVLSNLTALYIRGDFFAGLDTAWLDNVVAGAPSTTNHPPVLTLPAGQSIDELAPWSAAATATDPDFPTNSLTFALVSGPSNLTVAANGVINWTPSEAQGPGSYPVTVRGYDNGTPVLSATNTFTLTVNEVNSAPILTTPTNQTIPVSVPWSAAAAATDSDLPANSLSFALVSGPAGLTVSTNGGIAWTPATAGVFLVTVSVMDNGVPPLSATNSFTLTVIAGVCVTPPFGLVGWWAGDGNAFDLAGTNHGSLLNGATYSTGMVSQAFSFSGGTDCVRVGNGVLTNAFTNLTLAAWVLATTHGHGANGTSGYTIFSKTENDGFALMVADGYLQTWFYLSGGTVSFTYLQTRLPLNVWCFVTLTYDGTNLVGYLNGNRLGSTPGSGSVRNTANQTVPALIGNEPGASTVDPGGYGWRGLIDEVTLFNRALTSNEIAAIYAGGGAGMCKPLRLLVDLQPTNVVCALGGQANFTITASGTGALNYQWRHNGTPFATSAYGALLLANLTLGDAGTYDVVVSSGSGSVTSAVASLTFGSCQSPASGLIAWWPGDGHAMDLVGTNHGTLVNGPTYTNGCVGQAFSFSGGSDYVRVGTGVLNTAFTNLTMAAWVLATAHGNVGGVTGYTIFSKTETDGFALRVMDGYLLARFCLSGGDVNQVFNQTMLPLNAWCFVAATYDGTNVVGYLNGIRLGSTPGSGTIRNTVNQTVPALIGHEPTGTSGIETGYGWRGQIDEVTLFNRALSSNEVAAIYAAGGVGMCKPLRLLVDLQPTNQVCPLGGQANFTVTASGTIPLNYQWRHNGTPFTTSATGALLLTNLTLGDAGNYDVVVSNASGSVTSAVASLTVRSCESPVSGLVAWWPGDGHAMDLVGTNHGTLVNGPTYTNGCVGQAFSFTGGSDYVRVGTGVLNTGFTNLTLAAWVLATEHGHADANYGYTILSKTDGDGFALRVKDGYLEPNLVLTGGSINIICTQAMLPLNAWCFVAETYDGTNVIGYLNGNRVGSTPASGSVKNTANLSTPALIGNEPTGTSGTEAGYGWRGQIDEVTLFSRALSSNEVAAIYAAGGAGICKPVSMGLSGNLAFGNVPVGGTSNLVLTITNTGNSVLTVSSITCPADFNAPFRGSLLPRTSTNVTVTFAPTLVTGYNGNLTVVSDATNSTTTVAISGTGTGAGGCVAPPSGLVGWWPGDGHALDILAGNNGLLTNGATYAAGKVGSGFQFTNVGAGVMVGNPPALQVQDFTISAWIRRQSASVVTLDTTSWSNCASIFGFGANGYVLAILPSGGLYLSKANVDNTLPTCGSVTDTNFHHVALTKSGTTLIFYVDGVAFPRQTPYTSAFQFNSPACIGATGSSLANSFYGTIDELAMYGRPLTSNEITAIYTAGGAGMCQPPSLPGQLFTDDFALGIRDAYWNIQSNLALYSVDATHGDVRMSKPTGGSQTFQSVELVSQLVAQGDFDVKIDFTNASLDWLDGSPGNQLQFNANFGGQNIYVIRSDESGSGYRQNAHYYANPPGMAYAVRPWATNFGTFRMIRTGAHVRSFLDNALIDEWDYNTNDATFRAQLQNNGTRDATAVTFDNFSLRATRIVTTTNHPPVLTLPASQSIAELAPWSANATATDPDFPANSLTFALVSGPSNLTVAANGAINWTPSEAQGPGSYSVSVRVYDNGTPVLSATNAFTLTVNEVNSAPILATPTNQTIPVSVPWSAAAAATDSDLPANALSFALVSGPTGLTVSTNGAIAWTPSATGVFLVTVSVTDNGVPPLSATNSFTLTVIAGVCVTPPSGLVGWWAGDGNAFDLAGTNHGTMLNSATFLPGEVGQAFALGPGYVAVKASPSLNVGIGSGFTLQAWINPSDVSSRPIVEWNTGSPTNVGLHFWVDQPGKLFANLVDTESRPWIFASAPGWVVSNVFQHVALTYSKSSGEAVFYWNGQRVASTNFGSFTAQTTYPLYLGLRPGAETFSGIMDEVGVFNRVLSSNEIAAIYQAGSAGMCGSDSLLLVLPPSQTINEMVPWQATASAYNRARPLGRLTFALDSGPDGLTVGTNGVIAWTPSEELGPSTNLVRVRVFDDRVPPLSSTNGFSLTVREVNRTPVLADIPDFNVQAGDGISFRAQAADPDWPANTLTYGLEVYSLYAPGPTNASINPATGDFAWTTSESDAGNLVLFVISAADNGSPLLTSSRGFEVQVNPRTTGGTPPAIVLPPQNRTNNLGTVATFNVVASGSPPLVYQWRYQGGTVVSATNQTLILGSVQITNAGLYDVLVLNANGSVTSAPALLTVINAPVQGWGSSVVFSRASGQCTLVFLGEPGATYHVMRATSLPGTWSDLGSVVAGSLGIIQFTDANAPLGGAYYRLWRP